MTDKDKGRCPQCNAWLEEIPSSEARTFNERVSQMQKSSGDDVARGRYVSKQNML